MATNDYWIDIKPPKGAYGNMGLDMYDISPHLGGGHHHHHHSGQRGGNGLPLFYTVDYGTAPVIVERDDYEVPDNISGALIDRLLPGQELAQGQALRAGGGMLVLQTDGNLVLYSPDKRAIWSTDTQGKPVTRIVFQKDGNLVARSPKGYGAPEGRGWWDSGTAGRGVNLFLLQSDGNIGWFKGKTAVSSTGTNGWKKSPNWHKPTGGLVGDIIHAANSAASFAGKALALPGQIVSKIPVIGKPLRSALNINPLTAMGGMVAAVAHGDRLDHAFLGAAKQQIANVREIAPYVQMVSSMVPGIGTGVAAAMAAGVALSEGRTVTDAVLAAAKNAVPGGALGKAVFDASVSIAHGNSISSAAMNAALAELPPNVQHAAQAAIAISKGKNARAAVLAAIGSSLPAEARKALDVGTALAVARNVQSHVVNELVKPQSIAMLAKMPVPAYFQNGIPQGSGADGYKAAIGLLQHAGVTAHAIAAVREKLDPAKRAGFDHGVKTYMHCFTKDTHSSLVRGGVVTRGNWRPARSGEQGVKGRLIKNGKIVHGSYVRV